MDKFDQNDVHPENDNLKYSHYSNGYVTESAVTVLALNIILYIQPNTSQHIF